MGLLVNEVAPDSPAAKAGIRPGDVIKEADGHIVLVPHDISKFIITAKVGDTLRVTLDRAGKTEKLAMIVALAPAAQQPAAVSRERGGDPAESPTVMGIWFATLTPDLRRELHLAASVQGAVIGGIDTSSGAAAIGLVPGDVVISIDRQAVATPAEAAQKLRAAVGEEDVLILVNRHGSSQFVVLSAQNNPGHD